MDRALPSVACPIHVRLGAPWRLFCFLPGPICFNALVPSENTEQRKLAAIMFTDVAIAAHFGAAEVTRPLVLLPRSE